MRTLELVIAKDYSKANLIGNYFGTCKSSNKVKEIVGAFFFYLLCFFCTCFFFFFLFEKTLI